MSLRTEQTFFIDNIEIFKKQLLAWGQQYDTVVFLDSNNYKLQYSSYDAILAVEEFTSIKTDYYQAFEQLKEYQSYTKDYLFGYLSYDLKNDTEALSSKNFDGLQFPDLYFFQPQKIIFIKNNEIIFSYLRMVDDEIEDDFEQIINGETFQEMSKHDNNLKVKLRIHKDEYHAKVTKVIDHIKRGDIYEANFCQEFYVENATINPLDTYNQLNKISQPPFATYFKNDELFLLSASPERYIRKEGNKIISQPIKGTAKRFVDAIEDEKAAFDLARDEKERSENIMIVDLVRNDLSRTAKKGSVKVEELCKVYSFKQVHQLISTVVSEIKEDIHPVDVIRDTFPMGSMTGAPKISAMIIIEDLEETKRGLYSGSVGYFTPDGDFDFNVVIRSILYNEEKKYISYSVGGAITAKSTPEKEYEECLLKAKAMKFVLTNS
ncbi:para-aminobenzoate synthetase component 1 [Tenacibaculum skagerrakense]|uniref:aminodeoxychorismate synthase n=1 Tax=Tenacibaculum skagerrakense TaxID=186571 RepID=A0A4R2NQH6_9FLAO|nr:aminodeoxychorismate synthase component I [Tenacibaculum skagerrakense]TCP23628.1 para-aminobenzoate synthetase component 1 [Tenacibaculum skagerrakense]